MLLDPDKSRIFLTGFMGSGKSTVGMCLAESLAFKFFDLDEIIERKLGKPIGQIFSEEGGDFFRTIETETLRELMDEKYTIVALGGGTIVNLYNLELIREKGILICLSAQPSTVWERVAGSEKRFLLMKKDEPNITEDEIYRRIEFLLKVRQPYYNQSDIFVDTTGKRVEEIVEEILIEIQKWGFKNISINE